MIDQKNSILVVDDNPTNLKLLVDYLKRIGFEMFSSEDGASTLKFLETTIPDLILLDVMMPGLDGFELCRRLKDNPQTQNIPIIFMTALADTTNKIKGFEVGAVDYVTKPFQIKEVLARITTHLTIQNLQRTLQEQNLQLQQEIVQRKQAEQELEQRTYEIETRNEELEVRNKELDAFARTVAHNLKSPLSIIIGSVGLMQRFYEVSEEVAQELRNIKQAGHQIQDTVDSLLLLARIREAEVIFKPVEMGPIITASRERLAKMLEEYQAELVIPSTWPLAMGYGPWLEEVWVNYLTNAMKYGGQPPRIEVGATPQADGTIRFWVRDNGRGLAPEEQTKLFTEFTRLKHVDVEGHGLGLSIVRRIAEKLGGQVGIESEVGRGSDFYFTLPAATALDTPDQPT
jgi:signal transduction histidine kinase